ncbi:MAG: ornithine cyclodeaminase family protein [bacterium]|nr:ornithine cyclodeaminase family protein [bacterium]
MKRETILFNRSDIQKLMSLSEHIDIVENAFRLHAEDKILSPDLLHIDAEKGEFHVKAGGITEPKTYFGLKCNGGFFQNKQNYGLPNIQGLILLYDGENGSPLAIFESGDITIKRTGAATAVAAKYLAVENADSVTICGCGIQGRIQLKSLAEVRSIKRVFAFDMDRNISEKFSKEMSDELNISVDPTEDLSAAISQSHILVTCTPSREFFIKKEYADKGLFIAAVGADSPEKQELDPALTASYKVVADILEQCAHVGEIHHAIERSLMKKDQVHAELGEVITGNKSGRESDEEIIIYDATGTALQDVAAAAYVYEKSLKEGIGEAFQFPS